MALTRLNQFDFHQTLTENTGLSLIMFTAPGCGSCRQLRQVLEAHPEDFADLHLFEVDAQQDQALTNEFDVFHLPSLFLFRDGEFHAQIEAEPLPQNIKDAIAAALSEGPQEAP